jgi:bifunctional enzyme CysN/CysC
LDALKIRLKAGVLSTLLINLYDKEYRLTLEHEQVNTRALNEIGFVDIETAHPLYFDPYTQNRETGSFVLIDPATKLTVAAGMIRHEARDPEDAAADADSATRRPAGTPGQTTSPNVRWEGTAVDLASREKRNGHQAGVLWFTGLSGSGKSTIAKALEARLFAEGRQVFMLDGDNVRHGLNGDLGFSEEDRIENIRRVNHGARLMYDAGFIVLCTFISSMKSMRDEARRRDPRGLYKKAAAGEVSDFTGVHQPYQESPDAEIVIDAQKLGVDEAVEKLVGVVE